MVLAIDLGQKKTGLAISSGELSSPLTTIIHKSKKELVEKISSVIKEENIKKVIIGTAEGKNKDYFDSFEKDLNEKLPEIEIVRFDETLTTRQARETMIKLHVPRMKKKEKEHEVAAAIILQSYLNIND